MSSFINFKNYGDTPQPEVNCSKQMVANSPLTRQSSIYSLTFDELQNTLGGGGKDFGSMNMDELLKSIWSAEETQAMASTSSFGIDSNAPNSGSIQRQGSLTLPRTLSRKTVDEVWRELILSTSNGVKDGDLIGQANLQPQEREPTLGEMTLEDFLMKAGVVNENHPIQTNSQPIIPQNGSFFGDVSQPNAENSSFVFGFQNPNQNHMFNGPTVNRVTETQTGVSLHPKPKPQSQLQPIFPKQAALDFTAPLTDQLASPRAKTRKLSNQLKLVWFKLWDFRESGGEKAEKNDQEQRVSCPISSSKTGVYLELEAEVAKLKEINHELLKKTGIKRSWRHITIRLMGGMGHKIEWDMGKVDKSTWDISGRLMEQEQEQ
ncbi:hypothetical protein E3N88_34311 [Mikania micrantha]|uniref:BZIP domain-containing protein n=1 Tax=Mikania micrantha TaxID=192012 RepID=A0A5N6LY17_9ASTR|nr:hypothetical protein E3N88_34311 [Mikania micrantha]